MRKNKMCEYFHATDLFDCPHCGKKLRDFKQELRAKVDAVPIRLKQQIIDCMTMGGCNVGQAMKIVDPEQKTENLVWYTIIGDQIETHSYETFKPVVV